MHGRSMMVCGLLAASLALVGCSSDDSGSSGSGAAAGTAAAPAAGSAAVGAAGVPAGGAAAAPAGGTGGTVAGAGGAAGGSAPNMPDPTCAAMPSTSSAECQACSCTPNAMGGCLDELTACQGAADAMAAQLCGALIDCCLANGVSGTACATPCANEVSAALGYMSGAPLTAATNLGTCSDTNCGSVCSSM